MDFNLRRRGFKCHESFWAKRELHEARRGLAKATATNAQGLGPPASLLVAQWSLGFSILRSLPMTREPQPTSAAVAWDCDLGTAEPEAGRSSSSSARSESPRWPG